MLKIKEKFNRGFTMIELLIVIAVLGILAVAVLATINPIEQINRGRDTGSRGDAEQLLSAFDRYNATQGLWPWQTSSTSISLLDWETAVEVIDDSGSDCRVLDKLAQGSAECGTLEEGGAADEIKAAFVARLDADNYNPIKLDFAGGTGDSLYVCFAPQSSAFTSEATRRCDGTLPGDFPVEACSSCDILSELSDSENCICLP